MASTGNPACTSKGVYSEMATQESSDRGPIWADVARCIDALTARWGGVWVCTIRPNPGRKRDGDLWLLCERTVAIGRSGAYKQTRAGATYPSSDRLSMPSIVLGLLYGVDQQLQDDSGLAERQASS
jgi:hypothetical protein